MAIFSTLPQDLLVHIGGFWDDKKESIYRRILKLKERISSKQYKRFSNPMTYVSKMVRLTVPQELVPHLYGFGEVKVKITDAMCVLTYSNGKRRQFNYDNGGWGDFDEWIIKRIQPIYDDVIQAFLHILKKKYPAIFNKVSYYSIIEDSNKMGKRMNELHLLRNL
jgi:hypothetical protein